MAIGESEERHRGFSVFAMFACALGSALAVSVLHEAKVRFAWDLPATDVVTLLLAGAGLTLTAVGIFVAILALWGWRSIKKDSVIAARKAAERAVMDYLESPAAARTIDRSVVQFLERNPSLLAALFAERRTARQTMSELDDPGVDEAWGTQGELDGDAQA